MEVALIPGKEPETKAKMTVAINAHAPQVGNAETHRLWQGKAAAIP